VILIRFIWTQCTFHGGRPWAPITTNVVSLNHTLATQHYWLYYKVCQWLTTGWWLSPGIPVSSSNKTDSHDLIEILLKVALNTITLTPFHINNRCIYAGPTLGQLDQLSSTLMPWSYLLSAVQVHTTHCRFPTGPRTS